MQKKKLYTGSGVSQLLILFLCLKYFTVFFFFLSLRSGSPSKMGGPAKHCLPSFSQSVVGWYFWCEWCYLFLHPGRLVIQAHANPNLGRKPQIRNTGSLPSFNIIYKPTLAPCTHSQLLQSRASLSGKTEFPSQWPKEFFSLPLTTPR